MVVDLASQAFIRAAAPQVAAATDRIHVLINNAGISTGVRQLSPDGHEMTFAVNHLGHFLLTKLLLPQVLRASSTSPVRPTGSRPCGSAFITLRTRWAGRGGGG